MAEVVSASPQPLVTRTDVISDVMWSRDGTRLYAEVANGINALDVATGSSMPVFADHTMWSTALNAYRIRAGKRLLLCSRAELRLHRRAIVLTKAGDSADRLGCAVDGASRATAGIGCCAASHRNAMRPSRLGVTYLSYHTIFEMRTHGLPFDTQLIGNGLKRSSVAHAAP